MLAVPLPRGAKSEKPPASKPPIKLWVHYYAKMYLRLIGIAC